MNIDAALIDRWLRLQKVPRQVRTLAGLSGLSKERTRGALVLLEAVGKAKRTRQGTWVKV